LICYDFDGTELWKVPLPLRPSRFGSGTSPVVVDDLVVLNRDEWPAIRRTEQGGFEPGESDAHILAVHAADGTTAWDTKRPGSFVFYSTPVVWRGPQGTQVLLMGSSRLTSYDVKTGKELWWVNELPPQVCATPQVNDTHVYLTATGMFGEPDTFLGLPDFATFLQQHDQDGDGQIAISEIPADFVVVDRRASGGAGNSPLTMFAPGMDRNQDQKIDQQEWKGFDAGVGTFIKNAPQGVYAIRLGGEGDVTKTNIQWHVTRGVTEVPSLLVLSDRMFLVRNGGIVHCRDLETGQDLYQGRLGAVGGYYASPVLAGGNVYFASDRGAVTVIAAHTPRLEVLARNDLQEPIMATPAPLEGRLYVRTAAHLYAFGQ
jgi:outer membrane protein assembly factor BamB